MRLIHWHRRFRPWLVRACLAYASVVATTPTTAAAATLTDDPEDILGELVIEASGSRKGYIRLPKIGVDVEDDRRETEKLREVLAKDLAYSAEFEVIEAALPPGSTLQTWATKGAQAVVHVRTERLGLGLMRLVASLELGGTSPILEISMQAPQSSFRAAAHQMTDELISAYTGTRSSFFAQLAFVRTQEGRRVVYVVDADGHNLRQVTPDEALALSPVFGPNHELYYAASIDHGSYRLYRAGAEPALDLHPSGSIYGLAFSSDHSTVAVAIASGSQIIIHSGDADFRNLKPRTKVDLALHPSFSPSGKLAYAGTRKNSQRIYVEGRAVSPAGLPAASPSFCDHPQGARLVYSVGVRERSDLLVTDEGGHDAIRLTESAGRNSSPTCSPDGRLVAFFSSRRSGAGPGLYLVRTDGRRPPIRVANLTGDSLTWTRLPNPFPTLVQTRAAAKPAEAPLEAPDRPASSDP